MYLYHVREKTVKYIRIIQSFPDAHGVLLGDFNPLTPRAFFWK